MSTTGRGAIAWILLLALLGLGIAISVWMWQGSGSDPAPTDRASRETAREMQQDPAEQGVRAADEASRSDAPKAVEEAAAAAGIVAPSTSSAVGAPSASPDLSGLVRGRVVDRTGEPVSGVEVKPTLTGLALLDSGAARELAVATTDSSGNFEVELGLDAAYALEFEHSDYAPRRRGAVRGRAGEAVQLEDIELRSGGSVSGRVVDDSGGPISGVELWTSAHHGGDFVIRSFRSGDEPTVTSAEDGSFTLAHLVPGEVSIHAEGAGFAPTDQGPVRIEDGAITPDVEIVMEPGRSIAGRVIGPDGAPVAEAMVAAVPANRAMFDLSMLDSLGVTHDQGAVTTAADGSFVVDGLADGQYRVMAKRSGFAAASQSNVAAGTDDVEVRLLATGSIHGRVLEAGSGDALGAFSVGLRKERGGGGMVFSIGGDGGKDTIGPVQFRAQDGTYSVDGIEPGRYKVIVRAAGYADKTVATVSVEPAVATAVQDALLAPGAVLEGVVRAAKDKLPIAGVRVKAFADTPAGERGGPSGFIITGGAGRRLNLGGSTKSAETDEAGRFRFDDLTGGGYSLELAHPRFVTESIEGLVVEPGVEVEPLVVDLRSGGGLAGTVFDADGYTKPGARVEVRTERGFFESASTDGFGNYELGGLAPGEYFVKLASDAPGASGASIMVFESISIGGSDHDDEDHEPIHSLPADGDPVMIREGEVVRFDLFDRVKGVIEGVVTEAGERAEGVRVSMRKAGGSFAMPANEVSDSRGMVVFEDLEAGKYEVSVEAQDEGRTVFREIVEVKDGEAVDLPIDLPTGYVEGVVVSHPGNRPLSGIKVKLREKRDSNDIRIEMRGPGSREIRTDSEGRFRVSRVGAGTYTLVASGPGYAAESMENLEVEAGEPVTGVKLRLREGGGVKGVVRGPDQKPIPFAMVRMLDTGGQPLSNLEPGVSGSDGTFDIEGLAPGDYLLEVMQNRAQKQVPVRVRGGDTAEVNVVLDAGS